MSKMVPGHKNNIRITTLLFRFCVWLVSSSVLTHHSGAKVVDAEKSTEKTPWLAVIIDKTKEDGRLACHGSLVHRSFVLTAKGCVENEDIAFREVLLGTTGNKDPSTFQRIAISTIHRISNEADLLELATTVDTAMSSIAVLELAETDDKKRDRSDANCFMASYSDIEKLSVAKVVTEQAPSLAHTMSLDKTPQIVYFGFDDAVSSLITPYYRTLFDPTKRRNPNGCPHTMTLFVSHEFTDYNEVKAFYDAGHEVAVHSVTHGHIKNTGHLKREASEQKEKLTRAGIPAGEIRGWRSPFLQPAPDQPRILKKLAYEYDASLSYNALTADRPWPFTMEHGWPYACAVPPCPTASDGVSEFWEVPINSIMDVTGTYPCVFVDGCITRPANADEAFQFLMANFKTTYHNKKAPFGINMHPHWFVYPHHLEGMERFLDALTKLDDVYVVTIQKMLDWMKQPTPLAELHMLQSWRCKNSGKPNPLPQLRSIHGTVGKPRRCMKKVTDFKTDQDHCFKTNDQACKVDAGAPLVCTVNGVQMQVGMEYGKWEQKQKRGDCSSGISLGILKTSSLKETINSIVGNTGT